MSGMNKKHSNVGKSGVDHDEPVGIKADTIVMGCYSGSLDEFKAFAQRAKKSRATHLVITAEDLPWARWQYDVEGDPYPSWAISNVGLLKIAVPEKLKPFVSEEYAERVLSILEERCAVLRQLGLKAVFTTFEPQMLPEAVYEKYPLWRGPQVEEPLRARSPRFAPAIDHAEVQHLYHESVQILLARCPEIEMFSLHTNDSGSGISWSRGLYPGPNGDSASMAKKMYLRYRDFFRVFQKAAAEMNLHLEIDAEWAREEYPELFAEKLDQGMALMNMEGPSGVRYKNTAGHLLDYFYNFYPVRGIPVVLDFLADLCRAQSTPATRLFLLIGDRFHRDLYLDLYDRFQKNPVSGYSNMLGLLHELASDLVGESAAPALVEIWRNLYEFQTHQSMYFSGGSWFYLGAVQQRWLTRPFVPFPEELQEGEVDYFKKYLFQARTEERARSLSEVQSTRYFEGFGGQHFNNAILSYLQERVNEARSNIRIAVQRNPLLQNEFELLDKRLRAFSCVIQTCINAVGYQHQLDVAKRIDLRRPMEGTFVLRSIPERNAMLRYARDEIDNCAQLIELIEASPDTLLDCASSHEEEDIRLLAPDLAEQLRRKIKVMISKWEDYERLFVAD